MSLHPSEHDELLAALLAGERHSAEPEVARRLAECAACRADWELLRDTAAALEHAATARGEVLAGQAALVGAPGEERLLQTLAGLAGPDSAAGRRRLLRRGLLAAAALLVVGGLVWRSLGREPAPQPTWLGGQGLELLTPRGESGDFSRFAWKYDGPHAAGFTVRLHELVNGARVRECGSSEVLRTTEWIPDLELLATLPLEIEWEVIVRDEFGSALDSARARASRSSR